MSLSKIKIGYITSLKEKKFRNQHQTFVAEGSKLIIDLIQNTKCQLLVLSEDMKESIPKIDAEETIVASRAEIKKASHLATPPDAIAVFYQMHPDYSKIDYTNKLNLILDGVQDPGNLGTIIRIADWFGIENVFCSQDTADVYNTKQYKHQWGPWQE